MKYPPIARAASVEGDVVVSFRQTSEGRTVDVAPVSGPGLLQGVAIDNVKAWRLKPQAKPAHQAYKVTFHFKLSPPDDGYDDASPTTKAVLDAADQVQVISIRTTGLNRSGCPASDQVPPEMLLSGDFVELERWNEDVRVDYTGLVIWKQGKSSQQGKITREEANALLERFRTPVAWRLCSRYDQAGLMDGGSSSFKVRIGGQEKSVGEYGDVAPSIFRELELAVDRASNTHQWRHGDPRTESITEIPFEDLPKPGKTKLMDAAYSGDQAAFKSALVEGDKLTDVDASGWTPLMYAASSYSASLVNEIIKAGANVNAQSVRGETALMASAATGMADQDLLEAGANVNAVNDDGMTALMLLAQRGDPDEIKTLLKADADARKKDSAGRTALDYLNAANCGSPIVREKAPQWITIGYSTCNALQEKYEKSKRLLILAGAQETRTAVPNAGVIEERISSEQGVNP